VHLDRAGQDFPVDQDEQARVDEHHEAAHDR
jgi:hypothetical protein